MSAALEPEIDDGTGEWFYVRCSEGQALDIASGYVPNAVRAMVTTMLDWQRQDALRAERPVKTPKKVKRA